MSYAYTSDGERSSMTDGTGTSTYTYDADERLTASTDGAGASAWGDGYDAAGLLTTLTYPNGQAVTRAYNGAGQLTAVKDWLGNTTAFGYNAAETRPPRPTPTACRRPTATTRRTS